MRLLRQILEAAHPALAEELAQARLSVLSNVQVDSEENASVFLKCTDGMLERTGSALKDRTLNQWPVGNLEPEDYDHLLTAVGEWMVQWSARSSSDT